LIESRPDTRTPRHYSPVLTITTPSVSYLVDYSIILVPGIIPRNSITKKKNKKKNKLKKTHTYILNKKKGKKERKERKERKEKQEEKKPYKI